MTEDSQKIAEMEADIAFLLLRSGSAGSVSFTSDRWTGMSSNSLVAFAYGGEQTYMPADRGDYAACVRTYARLPRHRKTQAVRDALRKAYPGLERDHVSWTCIESETKPTIKNGVRLP